MTRSVPISQQHNFIHVNWYEFPASGTAPAEAWCYSDRLSYFPGETVRLHINANVSVVRIDIVREGLKTTNVVSNAIAEVSHSDTPIDCSVHGCNWPEAWSWKIPHGMPSGAYIVELRVAGEDVAYHHLFIVKASHEQPRRPALLICATSTWIAYNGWGGSSHYEGNISGDDDNVMSPVLSIHRPWAKGQVVVPDGVPRISSEVSAEIGAIPRYPYREWAFSRGYSKYYAEAGWAMYERHFVRWAEKNGYELDVATQHDLQFDEGCLDGYACVVIVGHDEYWSEKMRDRIDAYVEAGGNVARFGANLLWKVRLEKGGEQQVCYKYSATADDPGNRASPRDVTGAWEDPVVGRPGACTFGLNGLRGMYVGFGGFCPRHSMGFTVYRPEHWVFANTDTYFGDCIGSSVRLVSFEVDGVDFTFTDGLPYATHTDGAPEGLEVLAMAPATKVEEDHRNPGTYLCVADSDAVFYAALEGSGDASSPRHRYGAGMMATFTRGSGSVFNAGTCEWVNGLRLNDEVTMQITRNVMDRFLGTNKLS